LFSAAKAEVQQEQRRMTSRAIGRFMRQLANRVKEMKKGAQRKITVQAARSTRRE
jgi:hypothetical protein